MPRFTISDRVEVPEGGCGLVKCVWPRGKRAETHYSVEVDNRRDAVIYTERELRAAPAIAAADAVKCGDCRRGKQSHWTRNAVRCSAFKQLRSAGVPRVCRYFQPKEG